MAAIRIETHITVPTGTDAGAAPPAQTSMQVPASSLTLDAIADALDEARRQVNMYTTQWKDVLGPAEAKKQAERKAARQVKPRTQGPVPADPGEEDEDDEDQEGNDEADD